MDSFRRLLYFSAFLLDVYCFTNNNTNPSGNLAYWKVEDENTLCSMAANRSWNICSSAGEADTDCKTIAAALNGTDTICSDTQVCNFKILGNPIWVTGDCTKPGYDVLRNCENNVGAAKPNNQTDLSFYFLVQKYDGIDGTEKPDDTDFAPVHICDHEYTTYTACEGVGFRMKVIRKFSGMRLSQLVGGSCTDWTDPNNKDVVKYHCSFYGFYYEPTTRKHERCYLKFYNKARDNVADSISVLAFWGDNNTRPVHRPDLVAAFDVVALEMLMKKMVLGINGKTKEWMESYFTEWATIDLLKVAVFIGAPRETNQFDDNNNNTDSTEEK